MAAIIIINGLIDSFIITQAKRISIKPAKMNAAPIHSLDDLLIFNVQLKD